MPDSIAPLLYADSKRYRGGGFELSSHGIFNII